ncbi:uncharacterized protein LOC121769747 isoform X2 [Salvia splendens]|uniref:uncharacterized protein LOC121769747 isoform X2 n=1 Tax=Salvia splendens TaxID=180675 RepID=UPI001C255132|nr:uncharacterized protein LOC121769747 isoform X2 [Salvia splendens]
MAGSDSQKPLLTLIRDFTSEKSQGERRIVNQKKRIEELRSELDAANAELVEAKRDRENTDRELKGHEVELSMNEASLQALEARNALINSDVSALGGKLAELKSEENSLRDGFIARMLELNAEIRKFQEFIVSSSYVDKSAQATPTGAGPLITHKQDGEQARLALKNELAQMVLHSDQEEQQYKAEKEMCSMLQEELSNLKRKAMLLESVIKESMELQELSKQTSKLEEKCAAFGDELQKRFLCPQCNEDNSAELGAIIQPSGET